MVTVRVRSEVNRARAKVGPVGLRLELVGLVLGLELDLGLSLWFGLGGMSGRGNVQGEMYDTLKIEVNRDWGTTKVFLLQK